MSSSYRGYYINGNPDIGYTAEHMKTGTWIDLQPMTLAALKRAVDAEHRPVQEPNMSIGVKLFDKNNQVVFELPQAPHAIGNVNMVIHKGVHYSYRSLFGSFAQGPNPYARFDECGPPLELV